MIQSEKISGISGRPNPNAPKRGAMIKVEPIRDPQDIKRIRQDLRQKKNPLQFALFVVGINTGLRASELLSITAGQVRGLCAGDSLQIKEQKTGNLRQIILNGESVKAIEKLFKYRDYSDSDPLFLSSRGGAIKTATLHKYVKRWTAERKIRGNFGSHTLRKTFGYQRRVTHGQSMAGVMAALGHKNPSHSFAYLCIQPDEVRSVYEVEL